MFDPPPPLLAGLGLVCGPGDVLRGIATDEEVDLGGPQPRLIALIAHTLVSPCCACQVVLQRLSQLSALLQALLSRPNDELNRGVLALCGVGRNSDWNLHRERGQPCIGPAGAVTSLAGYIREQIQIAMFCAVQLHATQQQYFSTTTVPHLLS